MPKVFLRAVEAFDAISGTSKHTRQLQENLSSGAAAVTTPSSFHSLLAAHDMTFMILNTPNSLVSAVSSQPLTTKIGVPEFCTFCTENFQGRTSLITQRIQAAKFYRTCMKHLQDTETTLSQLSSAASKAAAYASEYLENCTTAIFKFIAAINEYTPIKTILEK